MSRLFAIATLWAIIFSLICMPLPAAVQASVDYTESVEVRLLGDDAFFTIQYQEGFVTIEGIESIERDVTSIQAFKLLVARASDWNPEFAMFLRGDSGPLNDDLIPVEGVFLRVEDESEEAANYFAMEMGRLLKLGFMLYDVNHDEGEYIYYSHAEFSRLVRELLWPRTVVPLDGFSTFMSVKDFLKTSSPILSFSGERVADSFRHTLAIKGIQTDVIRDDSFRLEDVLPGTAKTNSSLFASSSTIKVVSIGTFLDSSDEGIVTNFHSDHSGQIVVSLPSGTSVPELEVPLIRGLPSLVVTRQVSEDVLANDDELEITLEIANIGPDGSPPATAIRVAESWWRPYFDLIDGDDSLYIISFPPGEDPRSLVYRLRSRPGIPDQIIQDIEQNKVDFSFSAAGETFNQVAIANQLPLAMGHDRAAVSIQATSNTSQFALGSTLPVRIQVENYGNSEALDLRVIRGDTIVNRRSNLTPSSSWVFNDDIEHLKVNAAGLTTEWTVEWTEKGNIFSAKSNSLTIDKTFGGSEIPRLKVEKRFNMSDLSSVQLLNVSLFVMNESSSDASGVRLVDVLPTGMSFVEGNFSTEGRRLISEPLEISKGDSVSVSYVARIDQIDNYILFPAIAKLDFLSTEIIRLSNTTGLPLGVSVSETISPSMGFVGGTGVVNLKALNEGSLPLHDISLRGVEYPHLSFLGSAPKSRADTMEPGSEEVVNYSIRFRNDGIFSRSFGILDFDFVWTYHIMVSSGSNVTIFRPPTAMMTAVPNPQTEGKDVSLQLVVSNPSTLDLTGITVEPDIPNELIVKDDLSLIDEQLSAGEKITRTVVILSGNAIQAVIPAPEFKYDFGNQTMTGESNSLVIQIHDDVTVRYGFPVMVALLFLSIGFLWTVVKQKKS